jgi:hypothetical protein
MENAKESYKKVERATKISQLVIESPAISVYNSRALIFVLSANHSDTFDMEENL